jgi:hypothetical protein
MPYISTEKVAQIRKMLKASHPEFKFSVTRDTYSGVNVRILSGPVDFASAYHKYLLNERRNLSGYYRNATDAQLESYVQNHMKGGGINKYHYQNDTFYTKHLTPEAFQAIISIHDIVCGDVYIEDVNPDYGNIPNYYTSITIGKWDKAYAYKP